MVLTIIGPSGPRVKVTSLALVEVTQKYPRRKMKRFILIIIVTTENSNTQCQVECILFV